MQDNPKEINPHHSPEPGVCPDMLPGNFPDGKYGFFLCRKGTARILTGNNVYDVSENHLCIFTPETPVHIAERSEDFSGILLSGDIEEYYPALSSIGIRSRLSMRRNPIVRISPEEAAAIEALCACQPSGEDVSEDETLRAIRRNGAAYLRHALCLKVCEAYFSHSPETAKPQSREDSIFNCFLIAVFENCHRERTVRYYAGLQNLSPYYFSAIIRSISGKSALEWIENVTMTLARGYLGDPAVSVKEIASRLAFPDQSTFARYFRQHQGCSPTDYRDRTLR